MLLDESENDKIIAAENKSSSREQMARDDVIIVS